jgi:hypothetical protein
MVTPLCESFSPGPQLSPFRGELEARALKPLEQTKVLGFSIGLAEGEELSCRRPSPFISGRRD